MYEKNNFQMNIANSKTLDNWSKLIKRHKNVSDDTGKLQINI